MIDIRKLLATAIALSSLQALAAEPAALWLEADGNGERHEALALDTEVSVEVTGLVALTEVRQRFVNDSGEWAEGHYRFPLPDRAAVESLEIVLGERLIEGEIRRRAEARETYERARDAGQVTGLVENDQGNLFSTRVANIPPGETVEIRIGFAHRVNFEHGRFSLRFPTSSAPRFRPDAKSSVEAVEGVGNTGGGGLPSRPFRLTVDLHPGMALGDIESSHHEIEVEPIGSSWRVELAEGADFSGKDFELIWRPEDGSRPHSSVFAETSGDLEHLVLMLVPPPTFEAIETRREVLMVIDTSGSMDDEPIAQARESLHYALASLDEGDRFNIIEFDSGARQVFEQSVPANEQHLLAATRRVDDLTAEGGTNMLAPMERALDQVPVEGYLRQVVFITDGMIGNEDEVLEFARERIGTSRLFTVGIGHGVNGEFLGRLARAGRGSYTAITDVRRVAERMSDLIVQLESPVIHDLELDWPGRAEAYPYSLPDLYVGEPLMLAARMEEARGDLVIRGTSNGRPFEERVMLEAFEPAPGVAAYWARSRIEALEGVRGGEFSDTEIDEAVAETALEYGIVSSQTSLVAVDRTPQRSREAAMRRHRLETTPAHGRGHKASLRAMPATDAGSVPAFIRGGVALLLVFLMLAHRRLARNGDES